VETYQRVGILQRISTKAAWHASGMGDARAGAPVTLIVGEEEFLVERAVHGVAAEAVASLRPPGETGDGPAAAGTPDVHDVGAAGLAPGDLTALAGPTLFGGGCVVIVRSVQDASKDVAAELVRLASAPAADVVLVLTHSGGGRNKTLLSSLAGQHVRRIECPPVKRIGERLEFLRGEFRRAGRKVDEPSLTALLDAVGNDLRELAAACSQLAADTTGVISQQVVARYYRGRAEATGFTVADRAIEGRLSEALEQLRWALSTGVSPVLISSALAQGVRALGRVSASGGRLPGQRADELAAWLGMPPWKVDQVRRQLRGWTAPGIARAHAAVAHVDAQVKGEGASAGYALERAITEIVSCRSAA
jgi:DNA polymerase III subunit delta